MEFHQKIELFKVRIRIVVLTMSPNHFSSWRTTSPIPFLDSSSYDGRLDLNCGEIFLCLGEVVFSNGENNAVILHNEKICIFPYLGKDKLVDYCAIQ